MKYHQRDIVEVSFLFPDGTFKPPGHKFTKPSLVKCQIIAGYVERDVVRKLGSIKETYFNEIVDKIVESIF